eukprot:scaffold97905_cov33-Phaeocystis_antarctica.AAC.1
MAIHVIAAALHPTIIAEPMSSIRYCFQHGIVRARLVEPAFFRRRASRRRTFARCFSSAAAAASAVAAAWLRGDSAAPVAGGSATRTRLEAGEA